MDRTGALLVPCAVDVDGEEEEGFRVRSSYLSRPINVFLRIFD